MAKAAFACMLTVVGVPTATATQLIYDGFDYNVGERIIGQTNVAANQVWSDPTAPGQPGPGVDTQLIAAGSLTYPALPAPTGNSLTIPADIQSNIARIDLPGRPYTITGSAQSLFFSFTMQLSTWKTLDDATAAGSGHQNGDFFAGFTASTGGMSGANVYAGEVRIRREVEAGVQNVNHYQLGFHKNNLSGGVATWDTSQSLAVGDNVLVVGEYHYVTSDPQDDVVRLWINPTPGQPAGTPSVETNVGFDVSTAGGAAQGNINSFWFRSGSSVQPGNLIVDELRIGTSYEDVTPAGAVSLPGDFTGDGSVDGADFLAWQQGNSPNAGSAGDLADWKAHFGQPGSSSAVSAVPEPCSLIAAALALGLAATARRRIY
jgi:hypothetical protein